MERRPAARPLSAAVVLALLVAACSSSSSQSATTVTTAGATTTAAPAASTTTVAPTTSVAPTTTAAPTTTVAPVPSAAIMPEVLCIDTVHVTRPVAPTTTVVIVTDGTSETTAPAVAAPVLAAESLVYFAYENPASVPVAVPAGDGNRLDGGAPGDDPLLPTVFAAGRVSPAFVAIVNTEGDLPTWTLRGTDGVVRTAAPTAATPICSSTPQTTPPDIRAPKVAITFGATVAGTAAEPTVAVTIRITDLPALSVCPAGLTALPPVVTYLVNSPSSVEGMKLTAGSDGVATLERPVVPLPFGTTPANGVRIHVDTFVTDRCEGAGVITSSWATAPAVEQLAGGVGATCAAVEGSTVRPATFDECPVLGLTGGIKIRRLS